jgi:hypothetical protein
MKWLVGIVMTLICILGALIPEIVMYFTWNLVHPESEVAKIVLIALFWVAGGGMSVFFAFLGFMVWVSFMKALLD